MKERIRKFLNSKNCRRIGLMTVMMVMTMSFAAFASGSTPGLDITGAVQTSIESTVNQSLAMITAVLPIIMSIVAAFILIRNGVVMAKRFTKL